jgi:hypothetical protein
MSTEEVAMQLSEVGVYTVKDGKIVREEFLPRVCPTMSMLQRRCARAQTRKSVGPFHIQC